MSDIHGCYDAFMNALSNWDENKEHLVLMGNYIDRGPDSFIRAFQQRIQGTLVP